MRAALLLVLGACGTVVADAPDDTDIDADVPVVGPDAPAACAIARNAMPALDGTDDLAKYAAVQQLQVGAALGNDAAALTWDAEHLAITVRSAAFAESGFAPLHVYIAAGDALPPAVPASGKEYSGSVPALPFTPTHLIAARVVDDSGTGAYDGVYVPGASWTTRTQPLQPGGDVLVAPDGGAISVRVPWAVLGGCPSKLRLALHVVRGTGGGLWNDVIPTTHTPWQAPGGGFFELALDGDAAAAHWILR